MIDSLLKETSSLDVLVNNAGWTKYVNDSDLESLPIEDFQKVVRINLESVFSIIKESISLLNNKESNIINISSIAGYNAIGSNIAYCAAKAGVISLTKSFAKILGPNIRVNGIAPGLTNTEMTLNSPEEYYEFQKKITPMNRIAEPNDIAEVALSLVNNMKFVNGKTIVVDGGRLN
jgi:3-oxoacyl-[acyl-carrier protein] reductase